MRPRTLNVAVIGGGFMAKAHALAYSAMPMFFTPPPAHPVRKVIVDVTQELATEAASRLGFEESSLDWHQVVRRDDIDVVNIVTPNDSHAEIAIAAAEAGKHILCEKPLARSRVEAKSMLDAVEKCRVVNMVAFNYRRVPAIALARRFIESGRIGQVTNFRGAYLMDHAADPDAPLSWRFQKQRAGSGVLGDIGIHVIDLAHYLIGSITEVTSIVRTIVPTRPLHPGGVDKLGASQRLPNAPRGDVDVDDEILALIRFENGAVGSIEASMHAYGRNNFIWLEIHGTRGSITFDYERRDELNVMFADDPRDARGFRTIVTGPAHPFGDALWPLPGLGIGYGEAKIIECHDFCKAVIEGTEPSPCFRDGYIANCVADAVLASGASGRWVAVEQ